MNHLKRRSTGIANPSQLLPVGRSLRSLKIQYFVTHGEDRNDGLLVNRYPE